MNNYVRLLDCTLREAPLEGLMWGDVSIRKLIHGLEVANINIIEVGFLKDTPYQYGSTSFRKVEDVIPYLKDKKPGTLYTALVDYGRYDLDNLSMYNGKSIDAIRICFKHQEINDVLGYAKKIRDKGYLVCIQHVDTLGYSDDEISNFIKKINEFKPYSYAVVDTFGAMYEDDLFRLAKLADNILNRDIIFGFHGHNNMMLADANAQRFVQEIGSNRPIIVDSSLYGCGRGAGNAHTELMAQYMVRKYGADYDVNELLDLIDTIISLAQEKTTWGYNIPYLISGMYNAHTFNVNQLLKRHNLKFKDLRGIIERLDETQKKAYDNVLLEKLYVEHFDNPINDENNIRKLTSSFEGRKILLLAPGKTIIDNQEDILKFIQDNNPVVIGVNNLIEGFRLDYLFYSGIVRYQNLQYQDYITAGKPKLIITSNISVNDDDDKLVVDYKSLIKFGWVNLDSSAILLFRLLLKCGVMECYVAGMDGYKHFGQAFYKNELDTGLLESDRIEHTNDNIEMLKDIKESYPEFNIIFLTESVYKEIYA